MARRFRCKRHSRLTLSLFSGLALLANFSGHPPACTLPAGRRRVHGSPTTEFSKIPGRRADGPRARGPPYLGESRKARPRFHKNPENWRPGRHDRTVNGRRRLDRIESGASVPPRSAGATIAVDRLLCHAPQLFAGHSATLLRREPGACVAVVGHHGRAGRRPGTRGLVPAMFSLEHGWPWWNTTESRPSGWTGFSPGPSRSRGVPPRPPGGPTWLQGMASSTIASCDNPDPHVRAGSVSDGGFMIWDHPSLTLPGIVPRW